MSDIFRRPTSGEAFTPLARQVGAWNDAALRAAQGGGTHSAIPVIGNQSHVVFMKNATTSAVPRNGILRPTSPVILPSNNLVEFLSRVVLNGMAPTSSGHIVKTLEPIPAGQFGRCLAPGFLTQVKISLPDNLTYKLARPSNSTSVFTAIATDDLEDGDRIIELIWHETGPGEKWAVALMPGILRQGVTVLGPCGVYNPAAELEDSAFDIEFGGCLWPSRYGLAYNNLAGGPSVWINLELQSNGSTLLYSSNEYVHSCFIGSLTVYVELEFSSRAPGDAEIRFRRSSDDSVAAWAENRFFRWNPLKGGRLQFQDSTCSCASFPQELCISPPSR